MKDTFRPGINTNTLGLVMSPCDWNSIAFRFSELRDLIEQFRFQTQAEAIGEKIDGAWRDTSPRWFDESVGVHVEPWLQVPYIEGVSASHLCDKIAHAKELIPLLHQQIRTQDLTLDFAVNWGHFCAYAGAVELLYFSEKKIGHTRSAQASSDAVSKDDQRRWFAHYYLRWAPGRGARAAIEERFENLVNSIIDGNLPTPGGFEVAWFEEFLNLKVEPSDPRYAKLTNAFRQDQLSVTRMRKLVAVDLDGIGLPPLNMDSPTP